MQGVETPASILVAIKINIEIKQVEKTPEKKNSLSSQVSFNDLILTISLFRIMSQWREFLHSLWANI